MTDSGGTKHSGTARRMPWARSPRMRQETSSHPTRCRQSPATAGSLRQVYRGLQPPTSSRSSQHEVSGGDLPAFPTSLHRITGHRLSLPRQNHRGHALRAHLPGKQENQFQPSLRPDEPWASKRCTTTSGSSALWIMIWGTLILIRGYSNLSTTRSAPGCYPCSRYVL